MKIQSVEFLDYHSHPIESEFLSKFETDYRNKNIPLLIKGGAREWAPVKKWNLAGLAHRCGNAPVPAMLMNGRRPRSVRIAASDAISRITLGQNLYISQATIGMDNDMWMVPDLPMLSTDCEAPFFIGHKEKKQLRAFMGRDTFASMHFHAGFPHIKRCVESLKIQVTGIKKILFFAPTVDLQAYRLLGHNFSQISFKEWQRDLSLREKVGNPDAVAYECDLVPGDMLYIPAYWWHCVFGPGESISTTYFWQDTDPTDAQEYLTSVNYRNTERATRIFRRFGGFLSAVPRLRNALARRSL
jgi:hypothetical protein